MRMIVWPSIQKALLGANGIISNLTKTRIGHMAEAVVLAVGQVAKIPELH
jgi:hypothetical protein